MNVKSNETIDLNQTVRFESNSKQIALQKFYKTSIERCMETCSFYGKIQIDMHILYSEFSHKAT